MLKIFHTDIESTGTNHYIHDIHEIAALIEIDGKIVKEINIKMRPRMGAVIDPKALAKGNVTKEQIMAYPVALKGFEMLCKSMNEHIDLHDPKDKFWMSGYNSSHFENHFFSQFFQSMHSRLYSSYFWNGTLDSMALAAQALKHERPSMNDFTLPTVCRRFNIDVDDSKLHTGDYDVRLHHQLYHKF